MRNIIFFISFILITMQAFGSTAKESAPIETNSKESLHNIGIAAEMGLGLYTGGLGQTNSLGLYKGIKLSYFPIENWGIDLSVHHGSSTDHIPNTVEIATGVIPILLGARYIFSGNNSDIFSQISPHLAMGAGIYIRNQNIIEASPGILVLDASASGTYPGFYVGLGSNTNLYKKEINLGVEARYHQIYFVDANTTLNGSSRSGGYVSTALTLQYLL